MLAEVTKAEEAAEAERQAALALEPWPPDARLAPSSPQPHPPAQACPIIIITIIGSVIIIIITAEMHV